MPSDELNKRQSTILESFTADLESMFGLTPEVQELSQNVEAKRQEVTSGEKELQELEARLRETERRLARASRHNSPARAPPGVPPPRTMPNRQLDRDGASWTSPLSQQHNFSHPTQAPSYPPPQAPRSGLAMHDPRQYAGSNEYGMVDRTSGRQERGYA